MTTDRSLVTAGFTALTAFTAGCGLGPRDCTAEARASVVVNVLDGESGPPLCAAEVTLRDGRFSATLEPFRVSDCPYVGVYEREGDYAVNVTLGTRTETIPSVKVERDFCDHVVTPFVTVTLR